MYRCLVLLTISTFAFGQNFKKDSLAVVTVLKAQEEAWNRFDIPAFMEGYWNSPELVFVVLEGLFTAGVLQKSAMKKAMTSHKIWEN